MQKPQKNASERDWPRRGINSRPAGKIAPRRKRTRRSGIRQARGKGRAFSGKMRAGGDEKKRRRKKAGRLSGKIPENGAPENPARPEKARKDARKDAKKKRKA